MAIDVSTSFAENSDKQLIDPIKLSEDLILRQIDGIRSNLQLKEQLTKEANKQAAPIKESFCHAFYRLLGLPIINANATKFYNPGYYGSDQNVISKEEKDSIDTSFDPNLFTLEMLRENVCYQNILEFEKQDPTFQYRVDMLTERMKVDNYDESNNGLQFDKQQQTLNTRKLYKKPYKILRPFKCFSILTNNIYPITNSICAPFIGEESSTVNSVQLSKPYIEFVIRTRFQKDIQANTKDNAFFKKIRQQLEKFNFSETIKNTISSYSYLEDYIAIQMLKSLYYICKKIGDETKNSAKLINQINQRIQITNSNNVSESITYDSIDATIDKLQYQIAEQEVILSILPNYTLKDASGRSIKTENTIKCPLVDPFIQLVQPDVSDLQKQIDDLNTEKQKRLKKFNSINKSLFYTIGEVNGLGLIDIVVMMMAFWMIPKDHLLSMLDVPSFNRLYRRTELRNENVEKRRSAGDQPLIPIKEVISTLDSTIIQLLKVCEQIIKKNSV